MTYLPSLPGDAVLLNVFAPIPTAPGHCPVMNLLLDAKVDMRIELLRDHGGVVEPVPRP